MELPQHSQVMGHPQHSQAMEHPRHQPGYGAPPAQPGYGAPAAQPGYGAPPAQPGYGAPTGQPAASPSSNLYPGITPQHAPPTTQMQGMSIGGGAATRKLVVSTTCIIYF